jgi:membrane-bound metal-dependent hydrolase YbcI (DUF457 family)
LLLSVPIYVLAIRYLSDFTSVLLSPFLFVYLLLVMVGALFPDVDWIVMKPIKRFGHRNPITHSVLIPALFLISFAPQTISRELFVLYDAFTFGVATHLFGDFVKTGNLVWIGRKYENLWYLVNGLLTFLLLYFTSFFRLVLNF